ncbi:MAG: hypothetical protein JWO33_2296 [Caulobacteraceae bacterium]|nr:hypothetical protein [Caulobacteraceae bacterium]
MKLLLLASAAMAVAAPAFAQDHQTMPGMDHSQHAAQSSPAPSMAMTGALGDYAMSREASGTAWQPDASEHGGVMKHSGEWMLMGHVLLNGVYDRQSGPRGDEQAFVSGMLMGMAQRPLGTGRLQLKAMLSPDPFMGREGYPLLLASGETANGVDPLIDRQHPHELFMELSASVSHPIGDKASAFFYAGLPGEPAFGPPAFMHRLSILDSPEAPISHHWLDSTHIVMGVVTAGVTLGDFKLDASRFRGREPDQHRFNIETGALDSTAARVSWNPSAAWSLQASWADLKSPEQLHPDEDQTKWSASAIYTRRLVNGGWWSTTAAWGRRSSGHLDLDAYVLESAVHPNLAWTVFARAERTDNNELVGGGHGPAYTVGKASLGAVRDFRISEHTALGLGGLYAVNFLPKALEPVYGGDPEGGMVFVRLKID